MDLARCLEHLVRMLTPLPRLERTGSQVGCSPVLQRPSPSGRRVGSSEKLSRPAQGSSFFRPAHLHLGCAEDFSGGFSGRSLASTAPVATGRTDNSPDGTCTRWPSRPRRSHPALSLTQTSFRVALPAASSRPLRPAPTPIRTRYSDPEVLAIHPAKRPNETSGTSSLGAPAGPGRPPARPRGHRTPSGKGVGNKGRESLLRSPWWWGFQGGRLYRPTSAHQPTHWVL
jgi:hypothetical protein